MKRKSRFALILPAMASIAAVVAGSAMSSAAAEPVAGPAPATQQSADQKEIPSGPQLLVHSNSGMHATPDNWSVNDVPIKLWREGQTNSANPINHWKFEKVQEAGQSFVRIHNVRSEKCLAARHARAHEKVVQVPCDEGTRSQLWKVTTPDRWHGDAVLASAMNDRLVLAPREGYQQNEPWLELDEYGPWSDQFWRWHAPQA
jgi:hypothetical protein